jgi:hypothetical protein
MTQIIPGREAHPGKSGLDRLRADDYQLELIYELASAGKSHRIIALRIGVSLSLFESWLGLSKAAIHLKDQRVRDARDAGFAEHEEKLTSVLHSVIDNDKHKMQVPATMFMLKCKHKWSERQEVTVIDQPTAPTRFRTVDVTPADDEEQA